MLKRAFIKDAGGREGMVPSAKSQCELQLYTSIVCMYLCSSAFPNARAISPQEYKVCKVYDSCSLAYTKSYRLLQYHSIIQR